jgi:hypothetical protein
MYVNIDKNGPWLHVSFNVDLNQETNLIVLKMFFSFALQSKKTKVNFALPNWVLRLYKIPPKVTTVANCLTCLLQFSDQGCGLFLSHQRKLIL